VSELLGRAGLAAFVLTLAAVVMATTGSGGLGGRLGGLFGYHGARLAAPAEPVTLKPVSAVALAGASALPVHLSRAAKPGTRRNKSRHEPTSVVPRRRPQPVQPAPAPAPGPTPVPSVPKPSPGGPSTTDQVEQTIRQVTAPAPPAQAPAEQVIQTVNQVCGAAGGCPSPPAASAVIGAVNTAIAPGEKP
jgi:hypothetical protein